MIADIGVSASINGLTVVLSVNVLWIVAVGLATYLWRLLHSHMPHRGGGAGPAR